MISWIVFDDRLFIYDPDQSVFSSHPLSLFNSEAGAYALGSKRINLVVDTPFQLVPESGYEEQSKSIIAQSISPFVNVAASRVQVDTWSGSYAKCIYYLPLAFQGLKANNYLHWMSCIEKYSQPLMDKLDSALYCIRIFDTLYVLLQIDKSLKEAVTLFVPSPDDSSFHLLKLIEKYKEHQDQLTLITNETQPAHIRILKKFIPEVILIEKEQEVLIPEIIKTACA